MELHDAFFKCATDAIAKEDHRLRIVFESNENKYNDLHHGVGTLYETTYVYLILKELLSSRFPVKAIWEYPYPSNSSSSADLALIAEIEPPILIEFKIWTKKDDSKIVPDIEKLCNEKANVFKWLFIIAYGGNREENIEYLLKQHTQLDLLNKSTILSKWYDSKTRLHKLLNIDLLFFKIENTS